MTAVTETPAPDAPVATGHRRRRWALIAVAAAVAAASTLAAVLLVDRPGSRRPVQPAAPGAVAGVAGWFGAASGPTCVSVADPPGLPVGAVACRPASRIQAEYATLGSPAGATRYLGTQAQAHPGSKLTAWLGNVRSEQGRVLYFTGHGRATIVWTYDGQPYVGWASSSGPTGAFEAWWTDKGRSTRERSG